jgi:predicted Zn-dependent peptidase
MSHAYRAAAFFLAASLQLSAAMPAIAGAQQTGPLPRGGSYVLDPDPTVGSGAIGLWFRAPGAGYDNSTPGIMHLASTAAAVAPLASGKSLYALVHSLGGELNIQVFPDIVGIGAVVPTSGTRQVVAAMTAAYFAPNIDDTALKTARENAAVLGVQERYETDNTLHDLLFKQLFENGPAHYPPLPTALSQLTRITTAQVETFAKRAFRADNAVLTLTGNVDASAISAVTDGNGAGSMDSPYDSKLAADPAPTSAPAPIDGVGLAWVGPPISDEKAATALDFIADYLFRDQTGVVSKIIDQSKGDTLLVGQFVTLHDPGVMVVTIGGDNKKQAEQHVLDALTKLEQPMDQQVFNAAREAFLYHVASDTQTPQERADNLGWYTVEGNTAYAPGLADGQYERAVRALDPQYVAEIVRHYLRNPVVVNLVAAASDDKGSPQ